MPTFAVGIGRQIASGGTPPAALLVGGVVLLTKDEAAQKIVDRKMADFQPSASMMDTLDIPTEELKNTETTPFFYPLFAILTITS